MNKKKNTHTQHIYHYTAHIYKHNIVPGRKIILYDVEIFADKSRYQQPNSGNDRTLIYTNYKTNTKYTPLSEIIYYIRWKFLHCQRYNNGNMPIRTKGLFTQIENNIQWIRSIVDTEFDFHVGEKICVRDENISYMEIYKQSQFTGCDIVY